MNEPFEKLLDKYSLEISNGCNEPGYDDKPVITGNWNNIPQKVFDALEKMGYSCEWEDEWTTCGECGNSVRTSPNSYGWTKYYTILNDCELFCGDCIKKSPEDYLEFLENNPKHCDTLDLDLENLGYELIEDVFEYGWYPGQNDNPVEILNKYIEKYPDGKFIFNLDSVGQFDVNFSIYKKVE